MLAAPRDRWFLGDGFRRTGPFDFEQLMKRLLDEADPRAPLVWHKGFGSWTRAEDVPQLERRLAPVPARAASVEAIPPAASLALTPDRIAVDEGTPGSPLVVYGGVAAGVVALALLGWLLWPRPQAAPPPIVIVPAPTPTPSAAATVPSPRVSGDKTSSPAPAVSPRPPSPPENRETELPTAEVRRLRGVAAWSGETLGLTVENRTEWRITELHVRVSRFAGDELKADAAPLVLLPPAPPLDPDVVDLLKRVAPDRQRPGLYPYDTGSFKAKAGPPPEGFRWEIESARGYAPSTRVRKDDR